MPGICRLNNEAQLITSAQCQPQSLYCNSLDCRGMDKVNSHNFLIGGNKDLTVPWDLYSLTSYYLALFDDGLQQSNLWIFGGDMHYVMHSVIASPLGGCLLSGSRFPDPILGKPNAYLVLMGPDLILQTHEPADEAKNLRLSPNPASDWLVVDRLPAGINSFFLYDFQGRCLQYVKSGSTELKINVSGLPHGIYSYNLISREGKSYSGKWVKQ